MFSYKLLQAYRKAGFSTWGCILKQSLYPRKMLLNAFEGCRLCYDLGSGDGVLTNLLAANIPSGKWIGIDKNIEKVYVSNCAKLSSNIIFKVGDIIKEQYDTADAFLLNDVFHHLNQSDQYLLLEKVHSSLQEKGILVIKDVEYEDKLDLFHTNFWDKKIYPYDKLTFLRKKDWAHLFKTIGFEVLKKTKVSHPWVASRTIYILGKNSRVFFLNSTARQVIKITKNTDPKSILLTGASGFIGEHLLHFLSLQKKFKITVFGRNQTPLIRKLTHSKHIDFIEGDLKCFDDLAKIKNQIDCVFHLASKVNYFGGKTVFNDNLRATRNIIKTCKKLKIKKIVFTSTFGAIDRRPFEWNFKPLDINSPPAPTSFYGKAKLLEEKDLIESGLNVKILRLPWVYGPGMKITHHLRKVLNLIKKRSPLFKFKWPGRISMLSVDNCVIALVASMFCLAKTPRVLYLVDNTASEFWKVINSIQNLQPRPNYKLIPIPSLIIVFAKYLQLMIPFPLKCMLFDAYMVDESTSKKYFYKYFIHNKNCFSNLVRYESLIEHPLRFKNWAFITGSSSGIGKKLKELLYCCGYSLLLIDQSPLALDENFRQDNSFKFIRVDLSDKVKLDAVSKNILHDIKNITIFFNNAAIGLNKNFIETDIQFTEKLVSVNIFSTLRLFYLCANAMTKNKMGIIVNIASSVSFVPLPGMASYAASKAFSSSFSAALASELQSKGVIVKTIYPSGCRTNFQKNSEFKMTQRNLLEPNFVAQRIVQSLFNNKEIVFIGINSYLLYFFSRIVPLHMQSAFFFKILGSHGKN